jgi:glycopeptide antibiotics resistance protein
MSIWQLFLMNFRHDLLEGFSGIYGQDVFLCVVVVAAIILLWKKVRKRNFPICFIIALDVYLTFILCMTILGRTNICTSSLSTLFISYQQAFAGNEGSIYSIIFNVLLFIPLGILLTTQFRWREAAFMGSGLSLGIELIQCITHRGVFELSDLVNNSLGCLIGALMAYCILHIAAKLRYREEKDFHYNQDK